MRNALVLVILLGSVGCAIDDKAEKALDHMIRVERDISKVASDVNTILVENRPKIAAATDNIAVITSDARGVVAGIRSRVEEPSNVMRWLYGTVAAIAATLGHSVYAAWKAKSRHLELAKKIAPQK